MFFDDPRISSGHKKWTECLSFGVICTLALLLVIPSSSLAQLSPGKLAQPHKSLEGLKKCGSCHRLGNKDVTDKCLGCHTEIKAMQEGKTGLHGRSDFRQCVDCHVDHQGRDFKMIHWADGQEKFDHSLTGFELQGAHKNRKCRDCHKSTLIQNPSGLKAMGKSLDRTFLGLETACLACHEDTHQGQFKAQCVSCHNQDQWKPASQFDHDKSDFILTGLHKKVSCAGCHGTTEEFQNKPFMVYTNISHSLCTDCHKDPHKESFGTSCIQCHDSSGWLNIKDSGFDHNLTRYALDGKHAVLECAACHSENRKKPAFDRCTQCHKDTHGAQTLKRSNLLACEKCHSVQGFLPSAYGQKQHQQSSFPLVGAHQAVPCLACHQELQKDNRWSMQLSHNKCVSCHVDYHKGSMASQDQGKGCVACHSENSWTGSSFNHANTSFPLDGAHTRVACASCHAAGEPKTGKNQCSQCHADPHQGQFSHGVAAGGQTIDCGRCHVTVDWFAEKFDHETGSRFPLRGGHSKVACTVCHQPQDGGNANLLIYKPLSLECVSCHIDTPTVKDGNNE